VLPAALLCLVLGAFDGELAGWLERAGSADWVERERAQRWLATHLEPADAAVVAARAASGDAEVRERLARAIGGEARLVELAAGLALRPEPGAAQLGREALREQILSFDAGADATGGDSIDWLYELRLSAPARLALPAQVHSAAPGEFLDLCARRAPGAVALVLDPRVRDARSRVQAGELAGTLPELLLQFAAERELRVLGFGFGPQEEGRDWILLAPQNAPAASGVELLSAWTLGAADPSREANERAADARALAASGWPAGLALLESRWKLGESFALDGLVLAAGRGRVAPALQEPARQRALYASLAALVADEKDGAALARASAIARALAAAGPLSRRGDALGPLALEGFARASAREQWLRLSVLEGQGRPFAEALAAADAVLAARASPAALLMQALRLRAALVGAASAAALPADARALLEWAGDERRRAELRALWLGLGLGWPAAWNGLEALGSALPAEARGLLLELAWLAGAKEPALLHARALASERTPRAFEALIAALADLATRSPEAARALADALPAESEPEASHACTAALLAGLALSARDEARLSRWLSAGPESGEELLALASQAAGARGAEVRAKLLERLDAPFEPNERFQALERAAQELAQAGLRSELESFATAARERARALGNAELRGRLRAGRWPQPAAGTALDLARDERELERW